MSDALLVSFRSICSLSRALQKLVLEHRNLKPDVAYKQPAIELQSIEIATDALEILARVLEMDSTNSAPIELVQNQIETSTLVSSSKNKQDIETFNEEVLSSSTPVEHPPIIFKEIVKDDPPITLFRKFLSDFEANYLISKAEGLWIPSLIGKAEDLDGLKDLEHPMEELKVSKSENRTSSSCVMDVDDPVVKLIVDRVAFVSGYHPEHVERLSLVICSALDVAVGHTFYHSIPYLSKYDILLYAILSAQLVGAILNSSNPQVRYEPGQYNRVHHDGVFRPRTVFIYLNDIAEDGEGETYFPRLGLKFTPTKAPRPSALLPPPLNLFLLF